MTTTPITDLIKMSLLPAGDLYLSRTKAADLIRWLECTERLWREQEEALAELKRIMKMTAIGGQKLEEKS